MRVCGNDMNVRGHYAEGVYEDTIAVGRDRQGIDHEPCDRGVGAEEKMPSQHTAGEKIRSAGDDRTRRLISDGYVKRRARLEIRRFLKILVIERVAAAILSATFRHPVVRSGGRAECKGACGGAQRR